MQLYTVWWRDIIDAWRFYIFHTEENILYLTQDIIAHHQSPKYIIVFSIQMNLQSFNFQVQIFWKISYNYIHFHVIYIYDMYVHTYTYMRFCIYTELFVVHTHIHILGHNDNYSLWDTLNSTIITCFYISWFEWLHCWYVSGLLSTMNVIFT